jgi:hypothetical protein
MQRHLKDGCKECQQAAATWAAIAAMGRQESDYAPPGDAVRVAKSYFAATRLPRSFRGLTEVATLVLDTLRQPLLAGVRGEAIAPRQLLFRVGDLAIDIRVETQPGIKHIALTGQIRAVHAASESFSRVPVLLKKHNQLMAQCLTDKFGEFHLEAGQEDLNGLSLLIQAQDRRIAIPLIESPERP